jgi:hypothetical protein
MPAELVLIVREPRADPIAEVLAPLVDAATAHRASVTFPAEGRYILDATTADPQPGDVLRPRRSVGVLAAARILPPVVQPAMAAARAAIIAVVVTVAAGGIIYLGTRSRP